MYFYAKQNKEWKNKKYIFMNFSYHFCNPFIWNKCDCEEGKREKRQQKNSFFETIKINKRI